MPTSPCPHQTRCRSNWELVLWRGGASYQGRGVKYTRWKGMGVDARRGLRGRVGAGGGIRAADDSG